MDGAQAVEVDYEPLPVGDPDHVEETLQALLNRQAAGQEAASGGAGYLRAGGEASRLRAALGHG